MLDVGDEADADDAAHDAEAMATFPVCVDCGATAVVEGGAMSTVSSRKKIFHAQRVNIDSLSTALMCCRVNIGSETLMPRNRNTFFP